MDESTRASFEAIRGNKSMEIGEKVDRLVRLHMRDHPDLSYAKAARAIFAADADLHREYLDTATPVHLSTAGAR